MNVDTLYDWVRQQPRAAADEIERLTAELSELRDAHSILESAWVTDVARQKTAEAERDRLREEVMRADYATRRAVEDNARLRAFAQRVADRFPASDIGAAAREALAGGEK